MLQKLFALPNLFGVFKIIFCFKICSPDSKNVCASKFVQIGRSGPRTDAVPVLGVITVALMQHPTFHLSIFGFAGWIVIQMMLSILGYLSSTVLN